MVDTPSSAAVEVVGDIITSTDLVTAILPALSLLVVHTLVHTETYPRKKQKH